MKNSRSCTCQTCKDMCQRPCWPTPDEVIVLVEKGYGNKLMLDYWIKPSGEIQIVCPALKGYEGSFAPFWPTGRCIFQDNKGLCQLHDKGLKPYEGRIAMCDQEQPDLHESVAEMWDTEKGRMVVKLWESR